MRVSCPRGIAPASRTREGFRSRTRRWSEDRSGERLCGSRDQGRLDEPAKVANIACPVYGFYAGNDEHVNVTIPTAQELMKRAGKKYEPVVYGGAGHGFMREGEKPDANEGNRHARDEAWARWK